MARCQLGEGMRRACHPPPTSRTCTPLMYESLPWNSEYIRPPQLRCGGEGIQLQMKTLAGRALERSCAHA